MTTPILSSQIPSHEICDFDLVAIDGRLLLVCADGGPQVYTWDPSDDRWTAYRLDQPNHPDDFLTLYKRLPKDDDDYRLDTICAAVVDGRIVVGGGNYEEPFGQWDLASGAVRTYARLGHGGVQTTATMELNGRPFFLSGDCSAFPAYLSMWDASCRDTSGATDAEPVRHDQHRDSIGGITAGTLNGRPVVISGGWDGLVMMWDVGEQTLLRKFEPAVSVVGLGLATVDGRIRVVAVGDGEVMLGDPDTGEWDECIDIAEEFGRQEEVDEEEDDIPVTCMDVGVVEGRPVAVTGSEDGMVCVWSLEERRLLHGPFTEHQGEVQAVRVSELDGRAVAITAGRDGHVHVWDLEGS